MEAFSDPSDLLKAELAAEVVRCFGELRLRVTGSSMLPAIRPGDDLLIRHCRIEEACPGDVVLFMRHRRLFTHRVTSRSGACIITQGDGIGEPDPCVTADELLGRVIGITRRGKNIPNASKLTLPARLAAALFRRSAAAGRLFALFQGVQRRVSV
jgi:hypothetical protein